MTLFSKPLVEIGGKKSGHGAYASNTSINRGITFLPIPHPKVPYTRAAHPGRRSYWRNMVIAGAFRPRNHQISPELKHS